MNKAGGLGMRLHQAASFSAPLARMSRRAVEIFQKIVDTFPGTRRATDAQRYIDNGGHGFDDLEENNSTGSTDSGSSGTGSTDSGSTQSGTSQRSGTGGDSGEDTTSSSGTGTAEDPVEQ